MPPTLSKVRSDMILMTGAFGLIGTLLRSNSEIFKDVDVYDIANDPTQDVLDYGSLFRTFKQKKYDTIVHLAEIPFTETESIGESRKNYSVNLDAMQNLNRISRLTGARLVYCLKTNQTSVNERLNFIAQHRLRSTSSPVVFVELPDLIPSISETGEVSGNSIISTIIRAARNGESIKLNLKGDDLLQLAREDDVVAAFEEAVSSDTNNKDTVTAKTVHSLTVAQFLSLVIAAYPNTTVEYTGDIVEVQEVSEDIRQFLSTIIPVPTQPTPVAEEVNTEEGLLTGSENLTTH